MEKFSTESRELLRTGGTSQSELASECRSEMRVGLGRVNIDVYSLPKRIEISMRRLFYGRKQGWYRGKKSLFAPFG